MKVVAQLVKHFWDRGVLSLPEAAYLVDHGFVNQRELANYDARMKIAQRASGRIIDPALAAQYAAEDAQAKVIERLEARLMRRRVSSKRPRSGMAHSAAASELCRTVRAALDARAGALARLVPLARPLGACGDWAEATVVLRQVSNKAFYRRVAGALREEALRLDDVWQALDPEPLHRAAANARSRGAAGRAYLALLRAESVASLGKYRWVLHEEVMQAVWNLRTVYRRLLAAMNQLYHRERRVLDRALDGATQAVPAWALLLLHNANRLELSAPQYAAAEYDVSRAPLDDTWRQAWTAALGMDRASLMHLFVLYYDEDPRREVPLRPREHILACPVGWRLPKEEPSRE